MLLQMLLQSMRTLCSAPGGPGNIWKYLDGRVGSTGDSGGFVCGLLIDLHPADTVSVPLSAIRSIR